MAQVTYPWNPFQERIDCRITNPREVIKPSAQDARREFVPRYAPFYAKDFKLYRQGSNTPLLPGVDFAFAHPFGLFAKDYSRNVYGSVVLLKNISSILDSEYDTIGGPFVLNEVAYTTLVANIMNSPRQALWENLVNVPTEWPPLPHPHPAAQTYDYLQMMERLENLILVMRETGNDSDLTVKQMLEQHISQGIPMAHRADPGSIGLDLVQNTGLATEADILGGSANLIPSMAVLKKMFQLQSEGKLNFD